MSAYVHLQDCSTADPCPRCFVFGQTTEQRKRAEWLDRVRTWTPSKHELWLEGYEYAAEKIINMIEQGEWVGDTLADDINNIVLEIRNLK